MNNETENKEYMRPPQRKHSSVFSTRKLLGLVFGLFMFLVLSLIHI